MRPSVECGQRTRSLLERNPRKLLDLRTVVIGQARRKCVPRSPRIPGRADCRGVGGGARPAGL